MDVSKKKYAILTSGLAIMIGVTSCSSGGALNAGSDGEEVIRWRMATHQIPGTSRYDETILPFVEHVEEASDGRLIIEPFGAGTLFPVSETFDAVSSGTVELSAIYAGYWTGKDPVFGITAGLPGDPITEYEEHLERNAELEPIVNEAYAEHGVTGLGAFDYAPTEFLMSTVEINSVEDFEGLNIRAAGTAASFYGEVGASAVSLSAPEIYTALQLGTVDAAEYNDYVVNQEMGLHEVTEYAIEPTVHIGAVSDKDLIANPDAWDSLPDDLKDVVKEARDVAMENSATAYVEANDQAKQEWAESGVEMVTLPESEVEEMREIAADWLIEYKESSELTRRYFDEYARVLNEMGYEEHAERLGYQG